MRQVKGMFCCHKTGGITVPRDRRKIISEGVAAVLERCNEDHQGYLLCEVAGEQASVGITKLVEAVREEREN